MKLSSDIRFAIDLKKNNTDIQAPVNDVLTCIQDLKQTGISDKQIENMVPKIFISNNSSSYSNNKRYPENEEILIYDLPDKWLNMVEDSE